MPEKFRTPDVKFGIWTDYDLPQWRNEQLLVEEESAQIISNAIAVATTLALPRLLILLQTALPSVVWAARYLMQSFRRRKLSREESSRLSSHILETLRTADSIGTAVNELIHRHLAMQHLRLAEDGVGTNCLRRYSDVYSNFREDSWTFSMVCLCIVSLGIFYIGIQAVAILTTKIVSSDFGLSNSPTCGWWLPPPVLNASESSFQLPAYVFPREELYESISYAESHYGAALIPSTSSIYVSQRIKYQTWSDSRCPFDRRVCTSEHSTLLMDTGLQSSRILGINTAQQYFFRVQAICSPLRAKIVGGVSPTKFNTASLIDSHAEEIKQYYHAWPGESYKSMLPTFNDSCDDFKYIFRKFIYVQDEEEKIPRVPTIRDRRLCLEEHRDVEEVNLFFIKSCGLRYLGPSSDPIFPADVKGPAGLWIDSTPYPHVVGCKDISEVCDTNGNCFDAAKSGPDQLGVSVNRTSVDAAILNLLLMALTRTDMRLGMYDSPELLAERLHTESLSLALAEGHWQQEMRRRFDISLANLQGLVIHVAQGRNSDKAGWLKHDMVQFPIQGVCSSVKFRTTGWRNINFTEFLLFSISLLSLWVFTIKYKDRVLLVWLLMSLTGLRASYFYKLLRNGYKAMISAITDTARSVLYLPFN